MEYLENLEQHINKFTLIFKNKSVESTYQNQHYKKVIINLIFKK